ncbi:MAG: ABC transporter ATP-binding protein [candidate division NC10 bacterium]|nr:ABC transporter ATP-binding protein [candidate division NC10 bacterium]
MRRGRELHIDGALAILMLKYILGSWIEMTSAVSFRHVSKKYDSLGGGDRFALRDVSFDIFPGRRVAVVGRSGSGKSTLLHLAAGIDIPTEGEVWIHGSNLAALSDRDRTLLRRNKIGLVFQFFYLLSHLSVRNNVALPELVAGGKSSDFDPRVHELLDRVGLADRAEDPVQSLSGGEMQRIAICRALVRRPRLLLADEPTGNLDDANSRLVMDLMLKLASEEGSTLIYVTHSRELAALADESWRLHSGVLEVP